MPVVPKYPPASEVMPAVFAVHGDRYRWSADKAAEGVCLKGKTVLITGGTSGIGIPTVKAMAKTGAKVVVTARNAEKGAKVLEEVKAETGADITVWSLDLCSLKSVGALVQRAADEKIVFDVLINNAGVMALSKYSETEDGFETQLQVNYIAPALLVKGLLDGKAIAADGRIVIVSSIASKKPGDESLPAFLYAKEKINWNTAGAYHKWAAYCYAKGMIVMHCNLLTQRLRAAGSRVTINSVHPGGIITGLQDDLEMAEMQEMGWFDTEGTINPAFKTVEEGASTSVWAAVSSEMEGKSGHYCENCRITASDDFGSNESPIHAARGTAAYLWIEKNWTELLELAEEKVGQKLM